MLSDTNLEIKRRITRIGNVLVHEYEIIEKGERHVEICVPPEPPEETEDLLKKVVEACGKERVKEAIMRRIFEIVIDEINKSYSVLPEFSTEAKKELVILYIIYYMLEGKLEYANCAMIEFFDRWDLVNIVLQALLSACKSMK